MPLLFVAAMVMLVANAWPPTPRLTVTSLGAVLAGVPLYYRMAPESGRLISRESAGCR